MRAEGKGEQVNEEKQARARMALRMAAQSLRMALRSNGGGRPGYPLGREANYDLYGALSTIAKYAKEPEAEVHGEHPFEGDGPDCEVCGEGRCHYLHNENPRASR